MKTSKIILISFLCLFGFLCAGCIDEDLTSKQIAEKCNEKLANIDDYSATIRATLYIEDQEMTSLYSVTKKLPDKSKTVILESELEEEGGTISNGETMWKYNPDLNSVVIMDLDSIEESDYVHPDYMDLMKDLLSQNITLDGMEVIADRNCYAISIVSNGGEMPLGSNRAKVWIDAETWMPLQIIMNDDEENTRLEIEYTSLKLNTGVLDSEFEFDIPEDAKVVELNGWDIEDHILDTKPLQEVQELSEHEILVPSYIPDGYEFDNATFDNSGLILDVDMEIITLIYSNGSEQIWVTETFMGEEEKETTKELESGMDEYGEIVDVNGYEALLFYEERPGVWNSISWWQENVSMGVGGKLDSDELIKIAESIG